MWVTAQPLWISQRFKWTVTESIAVDGSAVVQGNTLVLTQRPTKHKYRPVRHDVCETDGAQMQSQFFRLEESMN